MTDQMPKPIEGLSTGELVALLSQQTSTLIRDELQLAQAEMTAKAKHAGVGVGMFGAGGLLAFFGVASLVATAILGLTLVVAPWLAALIVTLALFLSAGVVALLGKKQVDRVGPLKPERAMASVKRDITEVKERSKHEHN